MALEIKIPNLEHKRISFRIKDQIGLSLVLDHVSQNYKVPSRRSKNVQSPIPETTLQNLNAYNAIKTLLTTNRPRNVIPLT